VQQTDITSAAQLDAQLALQDLKERARLWAHAEGRFGWRIGAAGLFPVLLIAVGLVLRIQESGFASIISDNPSSFYIVLGLIVLGIMFWGNTQRQISALRVLLKGLERSRP
jgi:hypothetical protein